MKKLALTTLFVLFTTVAWADHADDGKCLDEIKHWNGLTESQKSEADAVAKRDEGSNAWAVGDKSACEAAYKQAIILATD
tara:strand:+ start:411 stop:650 length:240 start_codon:yes stop_codon:yes gene_type:complete